MIMLMSLLLFETMKAKALVGQSKFVIQFLTITFTFHLSAVSFHSNYLRTGC